MNEAGVDRVIIDPPTLEGERPDYAQEAVKRRTGRNASQLERSARPTGRAVEFHR
jgi:hypothetical protein